MLIGVQRIHAIGSSTLRFPGFWYISLLLWTVMTATRSNAMATSSRTKNNHQCKICSTCFDSRNRLFDHLKTQHGYTRQQEPEFLVDPASRTAASLAARSQLDNPHHDAYYRLQCQQGVMALSDWNLAQEYLRRPLPVSFWLNQHGQGQGSRVEYINLLQKEATRATAETVSVMKPSPYFSPNDCRVATIPPREWSESVQQALVDAQDVGAVNRQELCSMVPVLMLLSDHDQESTSKSPGPECILDLCSAPGSKTLQLLDQVQKCASTSELLLVTNDSNRSRLLTLIRRSRLTSHRSCLVFNASDGRHFPALRKWGGYKLKFDLVLADVPCSGDGTFRKLSETEWKAWNVQHHLQLHKLQLRLLVRALQLVKKGGRVVYSTCSLDPIENEAVVASAIARLGGPSVYRIIKAPTHLQPDAAEALDYSPGGKSWVVPHPKFRANNNPTVYQHIDQVPEQWTRKDIVPSMFPPSTRLESDWIAKHQVSGTTNDKEAYAKELDTARYFGDILKEKDAKELEDMLPNCCRILPQHLDSGGFFCAIIERANPIYYPACFPRQRDECMHHGRIYSPVDSPSHLRQILAPHKVEGEEIYFEGLPTLELAQQWLERHNAYVPERSETSMALPEVMASDDHNGAKSTSSSSSSKKSTWKQKTTEKQPLYTPLFSRPHPELVAEFCDFFGLLTESSLSVEDTEKAGVQRFPVENLVVIGGGERATQVTTCLDGDEAHVEDSATSSGGTNNHKRQFFKLVLVSDGIRSLFAGGAKFNPIEAGTSICSVPVPGTYRRKSQTEKDGRSKDEDTSTSRAANSGRYGLFDEAAEIVGACATKRIIRLDKEQSIVLLETGIIDVKEESEDATTPGAYIAVCPCGSNDQSIYLSCTLRSPNRLKLLTERRTAESWLRLVKCTL